MFAAEQLLSLLDVSAWIGVLGLLDECPILSAALTAVIDGRSTAFSATQCAFISTAAQVADVGVFLRRLADLLAAWKLREFPTPSRRHRAAVPI